MPERAADAVYAAFPSFRRLYESFVVGGSAESLADLRVGNQRLGPAKSRKVHRVIMATQEQAFECVG